MAQEKRERDLATLLRERREQELFSDGMTPKKDPAEVTFEPPGPAETWPIALLPDGEDVCGNGHVVKEQIKAGIAAIGKPPDMASVEVVYSAWTADGKEFDSSRAAYSARESLGFRVGDLWVNRVLEAAATNLDWGEKATFICTNVYAKLNNATPNSMPPKGALCLRYEVELLSWRAPQLKDLFLTKKSRYDMSSEERMEQVARLKAEAQPLMSHGLFEDARGCYWDGIGYLEDGDQRANGTVVIAPEGREEEAKQMLVSLYLNDALCSLKVGNSARRVEDLCTRALELNSASTKALYRRGIARTQLHEYKDAQRDLHAAAKLDPKSRDVRDAITELKAAMDAAKLVDEQFAGKGLGSKSGPIPRAPPGGGLRAPATVWLDIALAGERLGRLTIQLFENCPRTVENFRCLCTGERGIGQTGVPLHYKGCQFHRLIPGFILQGGDIVAGTGFSGDSIYGKEGFRDERFLRNHDQRGLLSMANSGPDTNTSQFFITLCGSAPHLDGKNVVFGQVVAGLDVLDRVESVDVDEDDKTVVVVCISACGELPTAAPAKATSATSGERTVDVGNKEAGIDTTGAVAVDATDSTQRFSEAQTIFEQPELDPELSTLLQSAGLASLTDIFREEELTLELLCSMKVDDRKRSLMAVGIPASDLDALEKTLATVL